MNIQDIRKQYPQYNDLSDQDLAAGLHKKFYSDLPFEDFAGRIGLKAEAVAPVAPTAPAVSLAAPVRPPVAQAPIAEQAGIVSPEEIAPPAAPEQTPEEIAPSVKPAPSGSSFLDYLKTIPLEDPTKRFLGAAVRGVAEAPAGAEAYLRALPREIISGEWTKAFPGIQVIQSALGLIPDEAQLAAAKERKIQLDKFIDENVPKVPGLKDLAEGGQKIGRTLQESISPEGLEAVRNSQIEGNLLEAVRTGNFSQLSFGKDPTLYGYALQAADVFGSLGPVIISAAVGPATAGITGGSMAAGEAVGTATDYIKNKSDLELLAASPYYKDLRASGIPEEQARRIITDRAAEHAAFLQGTVALLGGVATERILKGAADKFLVGKNFARLKAIAKGGALGAAEEGAQEFMEGIAADLGIDREVVKEIGEDSFANLILGMIGGGPVGAARGAITQKPVSKEDDLIRGLDKSIEDFAKTEAAEPAAPTPDVIRQAFKTGFQQQAGREPTPEELDAMVDMYEQRKLAERTAGPDATGRVEPSLQIPSETGVEEGVTKEPSAAGLGAMGVSGVPTERAGAGATAELSPLENLFKPDDTVSPQQKRANIHYNTLMTQPDNPVTQSLVALDTSIQKAKDAYADIAARLNIPSGEDMMGLGVRLPAPIGDLLTYPSVTGSAARLVNASKDFTSGGKRGSQAKVDSALKQVQGEVNSVDKIIADALAAAEDPAVQAQINKLNEQLAVNKGVAARQAEIAALPMEQRADKIKQIEDEIRAGLKPAPTPEAPEAPTPAVSVLPEGINDAQFLDAATKLRAGKVGGVKFPVLKALRDSGLVLSDNSLSPEGESLLDQLAATAKPADLRPSGETTPGSIEDQVINRLVKSKLAPAVADEIAKGNLKRALEILSTRLTNPLYKELAARLAELNLPTTIVFNGGRDLTRRQIDLKTYQQQKRLFNYVQLTYPDLYNKYFTNFDREENLEKVYEGIKLLRSGKYNVQPVVAEFKDVNEAFEDNIRGLEVAGAYYPAFDAITLDVENASNSTFLHEVLHAATEAILNADPATLTEGQRAAREELQKMYDYAVANIPLDLYGLIDIHEFVSEVFTNKSFQDRLKKITYKPAKVPFFTRLVRAIYQMVGFDNLAGNAMATATQLFSAVRTRTPITAGARFAPKGKRVRGPVSTKSWRTAEQVGVKLTQEIEDAIKGHGTWGEMLPRIFGSMWDAGNTVFRRSILGVANLRQIDDLTKTKFPQISGAIRIIEQMIADRNRTMTKAKDILADWTRLQARNPGQSRLMGRIMLEATIRGVDPDKATTGTLNQAMQDAWNGLNPEFKAIYRQVRNFYADSINTMISEMKKRALQLPKAERQKVIKEINQKFGPDKLVSPYFPLRRFGNYWFQVGKGNFKEFYEFETAFGREMAFRKRQEELSKGNAQQRALVETMRKGNGISELYNQNVSSTQVLKDAQDLVDNVTSNNVADVKKELKESLDQLIYILLPQQSVRKMFINRQSIQGASEDMLRVFATTAVHTAYQQSRFKFAEKFINNLINAKEYIKELPNSDVYDDYIKEIEKRTPTILSNEDTSMAAVVAGKLSDATFYFMLSAPFSAMLNILGMAAITMPYIGGRYGYAKANAVLLKNLGRYTATMPKRTISPALKGQIMQMEFPSIVEGGKLDPLLQRAADRFIEDNDINISQTNDIMDIGGRPSELYTGRYNTVKRVIAALFHQSERLNREVTLLSVFELAYEKFLAEPKKDLRGVVQRDAKGDPIPNTPDEAFELAIIEAKDIAGLSLGDFTRQMKPRYFTPPLLSVLTKFKQYSVLATYIVARNFYFTFAAPFRKGEIEEFRQQMVADKIPQNIIDQRIAEADAQRRATYKEGRRRLAGILGVTFLLGGAEALPFFTLGIGTLVKMLGNDDDDEFFDWDNWFKNYMEIELGGYVADMYKKMGVDPEAARKAGRGTMEAVVRGPASVITGGSLSERVSLDPVNLWLRDPRFSTDTRESVVEGVIANAGPVVGLGVNWAEAIELVEKGQYQRAFEKAAPAIVSKPVSAYRMADEGAKTKSGIKLVDNFTAWELAMQSVGLQPERLAQKQKAAIEAKTYEQKLLDRRDTLMDRLWMERGSAEAYGEVIERINEFNQKYPENRIEPKDVMDSFKRRSQNQMEAEVFGAQIQKNIRPRVSKMLEYGRE